MASVEGKGLCGEKEGIIGRYSNYIAVCKGADGGRVRLGSERYRLAWAAAGMFLCFSGGRPCSASEGDSGAV